MISATGFSAEEIRDVIHQTDNLEAAKSCLFNMLCS